MDNPPIAQKDQGGPELDLERSPQRLPRAVLNADVADFGELSEQLRQVRPQGVDVASGVESSPGVKDPGKVKEFVRQGREAFGRR